MSRKSQKKDRFFFSLLIAEQEESIMFLSKGLKTNQNFDMLKKKEKA